MFDTFSHFLSEISLRSSVKPRTSTANMQILVVVVGRFSTEGDDGSPVPVNDTSQIKAETNLPRFGPSAEHNIPEICAMPEKSLLPIEGCIQKPKATFQVLRAIESESTC